MESGVVLLVAAALLTIIGGNAFRRDAVESYPANTPRLGYLYQSSRYGATNLPLRSAVEKVPTLRERSQEKQPLREAVEKRLSPIALGAWWRKIPMIKQSDRHGKRVFCFVESWASYRRSPATFTSDNIDPHSCSHIVYAFATVDVNSNTIAPGDPEFDIVKGGFRSIVGLKRRNSSLKVLLSVTGRFSEIAATPAHRKKFIKSVGRILAEHGFDGLDIHWENPGDIDDGGRREDKENLSLLIEDLSTLLAVRGWILTASVSPSVFAIRAGYDIPRIAPHLHFILLKSYDFNQDVEEESSYALHPSPLLEAPVEQEPISVFMNVDYVVRYWLSKGVHRSQLILGIPLFGRSYTLADPNEWSPGAPVTDMGNEARYTQQPGLMAYYEICERLKSRSWMSHRDTNGAPFMVYGDQWVGYEDEVSIRKKMEYLKRERLGGVMVYALDLDDFSGTCGEKYPLLTAVRSALQTNDLLIKPDPGVGMTTISTPTVFENCQGEGYAADKASCSVYYRCIYNWRTTYICPEGLYFDPMLNLCNFPAYVSCPFDNERDKTRTELNEVALARIRQEGYYKKKNDKKVVCYTTNWSWTRKGDGRFMPENLRSELCSHIIYAFASLDPASPQVTSFDTWSDIDNGLYKRVANLKNGGAEVLLAVGGWTDSVGDKYSKLAESASSRKKFVKQALGFIKKHGFTGLSMEWNYPVCWQSNCKKGPKSDKDNYVQLIKELREAFDEDKSKPTLGISVSGYKEIIRDGFDVKALSRYVDLMNVMTFDYHGAWEGVTGHVSPLKGRPGDIVSYYNTESTVKYMLELGAEPDKIIVGVPLYGQTFTLKKSSEHDIGSKVSEQGEPGNFTNQPGMLAFYEICQNIKNNNWREESNNGEPYAYHENQWVSFDDEESILKKGEFVKSEGLGGLMGWTVDLDDFLNTCCRGQFPLLFAMNKAVGRPVKQTVSGCSRPPPPATPPPPTTPSPTGPAEWTEWMTEDMTSSTSTTQASTPWWEETTKPTRPTKPSTTTTRPTQPPTTTRPWWEPATSPTTPSTTTKPWWEPPSTTTPTTTTTRRTTTTTRRTTTTTRRTTTTMPTTERTTTALAEEVNEVLPSSCNTGDYRPYPGNCNAYYRCILGEYRKQNCAGGLHWNNKKQICDWPSEAKCNLDSQQAPSTSSSTTTAWWTTTPPTTSSAWWTTTPPTTSSAWWTTKPSTSTTPWWAPEPTTRPTNKPNEWTTTRRPMGPPTVGVDAVCTNGQYYPVPGSCSKFYQCVNGILIEQSCAPGLQWNADTSMCDWAFTVNCNENFRFTFPYLLREAGCSKGQFTPYPGSCNKYLQCQWDKYEVFSCAPGLHWSQKLQTCDWPASAGCKKKTTSEEEPDIDSVEVEDVRPPSTSRPTSTTEWMWNPESTTKPSTSKPSTTTEWTWKPENEWSWTTSTTTEEPWPETPYQHPISGYYKVVCYFTNWAWYRPGKGKYLPEDIDSDLCTHIVYGFAVLDSENLIIKAHDSWADFDNNFYKRVVWFRRKGVKVSLAIGGWNDSLGDKYSRLVNNPSARRRFIDHVVAFLLKHKFDGLDLDWEYPKCWQTNCNQGKDSDKEAFGLWVRELRAEFDKHDLLLSAAVSPSKKIIDVGYDLPAMAAGLDWIAVMCYDYHGQWDKKTGHVAPMYEHPDDDFYYFNTNYTINYWIDGGVPRRKLVLGMPLYGQGFTLADPKKRGLNAPAPGPATAGEETRAAGFLAYYEICDRVHNRGWKVVKDREGRIGPYAYKGNQWVGFDDVEMIKYKSEWIRKMDLGGGMVWALDLDDFRNTCGEGKHPLLSTIAETLAAPPSGTRPEGGSRPRPDNPKPIRPGKPSRPKPPPETTYPVEVSGPPEDNRPLPPKPSKPPKGNKPTEHPSPPAPETTTGMTTEAETEPTTTRLPLPGPEGDFKVVCYFTNWAWYRQGTAKYLPSDIDANLCTHIVYGFTVLDGSNLIIKPHDSWADLDNKFYEKVTAFKDKGVKVLVAIGGWNDSAGDKYSKLVNNPGSRSRFIQHVLKFILDNNFDGLDLDWEYPKCWQVDCKAGPESDKEAFADFVTELRDAFTPHGLLLSAAVSPAKSVIDAGYDVPVLSAKLDWIAVMCYDYHGQWDKKTGHVAPMYAHEDDFDVTFNANFTMHYWVRKGADLKKLVMGMPMYGQSFSLAEVTNNGLNVPTYGGGEAGDGTRARGFLAYYEICDRILNKGWQVTEDESGSMGPYAVLRDQWVGFDDAPMIKYKSEFVKHYGFGGAMIWALDLDDFRNSCGCEEYPLLRTINRVLRNYPNGPLCSITGKMSSGPSNTLSHVAETPTDIREITTGSCPDIAGNKEDCTKFYLCQYGKLIQQQCPPGLHFNKKNLLCDWPENAKCKEDTSENEVDPGVEAPQVPDIPDIISLPTTQRPDDNEVILGGGNELDGDYKVVCYFTNWAWYRLGTGKYSPEDIDTSLCTHIVYAFAVLDPNSLQIKSHDPWADIDNEFYVKVANLKKKGIKVVLGLGGWNDSEGNKYSRLVNDVDARARFVKQAVHFISKYNFQGLDLDWEYPKCWQVDCNKGPESDKEGFSSLIKELSFAFRPRGWLLSAAVSPSKLVIDQGYDVTVLSDYLDWISLMAYDFHGHWDKQTGHVAPLYYNEGDTYSYFNTNFSVQYWLKKGARRDKLVLGMPLYGQSFSLSNSSNHGLNAPISGPGSAGQFTRAAGFLAFYEICEIISGENWNVVRNEEGNMGPYAYKGNQWVSYDDVEDIRKKSKYIKSEELAGGMVWALDLDDFRNKCGCGTNPLLSTINQELRGAKGNTNNCT